jgi:uncharacterized membrane protein
MERRPIKAHWFLWVIVGGSFLASILLYNKLPEQMPMHWNIAGEVDRYGSRLEGAFLMPLLNAGLLLMMIWLPAIDPRRKSYAKFEGFYKLFQWVMVIFLTGMHGLILAWTLGYHLSISLYVKLAIGILFIIIGSYLGKVRSNWFVGIKNPWTLENDEVWIKTHRLAGPLMFGTGVISIVLAFVNNNISFWIIVGSVILAAIIPNVYSYVIFQRIGKDRTML